MTDQELLEKKLAFIETCLRELESLANPSAIETDIKERRFIEHTLQICVQAAQDVASHIVSDEKLGEPATNLELFTLLAGAGWLDDRLARAMRAAVGFRNVVVHGYTAVDPVILRDVVENHLSDIVGFIAAVRARLLQP
jgi:uncharacterized protein YutE (UPF0331/DUF86 family)